MKTHITIILMTAAVFAGTIFLIVDYQRATEDEVVGRFRAYQIVAVRELTREMEHYLRARSQGLQVLSSFASLQHRDSEKMAADIQQYFEYVKKNYVKAISVYDEKGIVIYSTTEDAIGRNYAECDFFQWATRKENKGKQFVSSLIRATQNQSDRVPYFRFLIAAPVYQEARDSRYPKPSHKFAGVLTVTIDLEEVTAAFLPVLSNNTTKQQVWIVDASGTVLFQPEHREMVLNSIHRRDETCMRCHVSLDYVEKVLAEKQGTIEYTLREQPKKLAAFAPLTFENGTWIIAVNVSLDEVSGFLAKRLVETFLLIGVIAVAFVGASALIYRSNRLKIRAQEEAKQWKEKHALEERIVESEGRYRMLVETSSECICNLDLEGKFLFMSTAGLEMHGMSESEVRKLHCTEFAKPEYRPLLNEMLEKARNGERVRFEFEGDTVSGAKRFDSTLAPVRDESGKVVSLMRITMDITERKRAEEALKENEQRYRSLTEFAITGVYLIQEGVFGYVNPVLATMFGYDVDEIMNKLGPLDLTAPEDRDVVTENIRKRVEGVIPQIRYSLKGLRKDGQRLDIEVHGTRIEYNGKPAIIGTLLDITERRRAEEALQKTTELLETIFDSTHMLTAYMDSQFNFVRVNRAYAEADERESSFFPGKNHFALYPNAENEAIFQHVVETGQPYFAAAKPFEYAEHPGRGVSYWDWSLVPVKNPGGAVTGLVLTVVNVTERKRAEEELRESEERFTAFMNNSPIVAWLKDPATWTFRYINNAFEEVFDITQEVITKKTDFDLWPEEIARQLRENDLRVMSSDKPIQTTEDVPLPDGSVHHWLVFKFPLHTPSGKRFLAGTAVDITERKRAEDALRRSEEKYRALLGHMNDGLLVVDNNDAIQFVNEKMCKMVGYLQEELIGNIGYRMLLPEESWNLVQEKNRRRIREISEQYELNMKKKSGERFWASVSASPLYGSKGEVIGSMAVLSDISERKLAEESSRQAAEEIGKAHEQLVELNKHLTEVREVERALISREIHDELGQSLTALKIDLNWALEHIGKKPAVKQRLNGMLDIVNSTVKNVQRIASELRPSMLDDLGLAPAIEWYCGEFEKRTGVKCRTDLEEIQSKDPHQNLTMFRILQEALTNVIRHAHAKMVMIKLSRLDEDITLEIKDDGIGTGQNRIDSKESLGFIGMHERTNQFNGRLEIFSPRKKGTTVRISFPIHA